jgi:hypothetical protein
MAPPLFEYAQWQYTVKYNGKETDAVRFRTRPIQRNLPY